MAYERMTYGDQDKFVRVTGVSSNYDLTNQAIDEWMAGRKVYEIPEV